MTALRKVIVGIIITIPIRTILMITVAAVVITRATVEEGMMKETISLVLDHDHPDDIIILAVDVVEGRVLRHPIIDVAEVPTQKVAAVEDMAAMVEAVVVLGVEAVVVVAAVVVVLVEILPLPALRKNTPTKKENSSCTPTWCRTRATSRCLRCCLTPYPPSMVSTAPQLPPAQCRLSRATSSARTRFGGRTRTPSARVTSPRTAAYCCRRRCRCRATRPRRYHAL
mmetsp:Transcript_30298/g.40458  ORF Transcript_30298/g.40458 Transcript_30298/m.40458 type:complete len:226 (+) Transcript_30298:250-927(+)